MDVAAPVDRRDPADKDPKGENIEEAQFACIYPDSRAAFCPRAFDVKKVQTRMG